MTNREMNDVSGYAVVERWLQLGAGDLNDRLAQLAAYGRSLTGKPRAQRAVQTAVEVIDQLYREPDRG